MFTRESFPWSFTFNKDRKVILVVISSFKIKEKELKEIKLEEGYFAKRNTFEDYLAKFLPFQPILKVLFG